MAFFQSKHLWVNELADRVAALVLDAPHDPAHLLTDALVSDLEQAVAAVAASTRFDVLIVKSNQPASFCGGLDPRWLAELSGPAALAELSERGQRLCDALAGLPIPSVAVVAGACLGAGLELALACDYRVAVDRPATSFGFPQIELGLVPAWGGTQRLPRVVGLEKSFLLLLGGRRWSARDADRHGLADALADEHDAGPPDFLAAPVKRDATRFQRRGLRQRLVESHGLGRWLVLRGAERVLRERLPDDLPAPWEALQALRVAVAQRDLQPGLDFEREALQRLADSNAFRNLLRFQLEQERRRPTKAERIGRVGIVGGTERGLALLDQVLRHGGQVVLHESEKLRLGMALLQIHGLYRGEVLRGSLTPDGMKRYFDAIHGTTSWQGFEQVDLVLDAVSDDPDAKAQRFTELERRTGEQTLLVNTDAACPVAELREGPRQRRRVAGLHFVEPLGRGSLVEVVRGAPEVERRLIDWAASLGKTVVPVADLLVLRVLLPALNEAARLVREGLSPRRVDEAMTRFGLTLGPLEYVDLLGTDAVARLIETLEPTFADYLDLEPGFATMAEAGWLGKQSGQGFYEYQQGRRKREHAAAVRLWRADEAEPLPALSVAEQARLVRDRLVPLMVLEATRCLDEEIVSDAATLDFAFQAAGWAPHRGGPLTYAKQASRGSFLALLAELSARHGPRYAPTPTLLNLLADAPQDSP